MNANNGNLRIDRSADPRRELWLAPPATVPSLISPVLCLVLLALALLLPGALVAEPNADGRVLRVGPGLELARPSAAARVAVSGDTVEIAAGEYVGDVAVWTQSGLTLRGVDGRAHLRAGGNAAEGKAIWVIKGNHVTVENIEFSGTRVPSLNGAGIRAEGAGLTIRNCHFHDNENNILTNHNPDSVLMIIDSELRDSFVDFERTGRLGHNIYVGNIARLLLQNSDVHGAKVGHQVKSRARQNDILNNRIEDRTGGSSYLIDLSNGGKARIIGNTLHQSASAPNRTAIAFAPEGNRHAAFGTELEVSFNSIRSDGSPGTFVRNFTEVPVLLQQNTLIGNLRALDGPGTVE